MARHVSKSAKRTETAAASARAPAFTARWQLGGSKLPRKEGGIVAHLTLSASHWLAWLELPACNMLECRIRPSSTNSFLNGSGSMSTASARSLAHGNNKLHLALHVPLALKFTLELLHLLRLSRSSRASASASRAPKAARREGCKSRHEASEASKAPDALKASGAAGHTLGAKKTFPEARKQPSNVPRTLTSREAIL